LVVVGGWKTGVVTEAETQTPSGRSITLHVPGWGGNIAGQHLDARVTAPDGYQAARSYSVASAGPGDILELAVDRYPGGEVSPYLVDDLQIGDQLEIRGPLGGFFLWRPESPDPVQLIGGGSGVAPLMAMIRSRRDSGSTAPFRLLYSVRTPADVYFMRELEQDMEGVEVTVLYTRKAPDGWPRPVGRITEADIREHAFPPDISPAVFVCGTTGFVESVATWLVQMGHDPDRVKTERFGGE
jgi:ferredoxin-NADP reductase